MTKQDNNFFVSVDRQTFLGFEMTSNSRDTCPLKLVLGNVLAETTLQHHENREFKKLLRRRQGERNKQ